MISLDNLTVSYGGWTLFDNISLLINPKDRIGLVGKNGAGKTTLLRIITGEQQPTSGAVTLNGDCTIGYLPQTMRVADTTTLAEARGRDRGPDARDRRAHRLRKPRIRTAPAPSERRAGPLSYPRRRDPRRGHREDAAGPRVQTVGFRARHERVLGRLAHAHRARQTAAAKTGRTPA